jgi:hypothetical protein
MKITKIISALTLSFLLSLANSYAQHHKHNENNSAVDTVKGSPAKETHQIVRNNHWLIKYHSPAVRDRTIWGGLVAYGQVWVTGAHSATSVEFSEDIIIQGTTIKAGKYAFFTIPSKKKWIVIFNKNWEQHLADKYDSKEDVLRFEVKPKKLKQNIERLKYELKALGEKKGEFLVAWEKLEIRFEFQNK